VRGAAFISYYLQSVGDVVAPEGAMAVAQQELVAVLR
jgi:hypothetical protein